MGEKVEREVYALTDLEMMCEKYYKYVNSYALSLCCDETLAEDITQETFCNAIKNIDSFKGNCQIETWVCSIARNVFLNFKRQKTTENIDDYTHIASEHDVFAHSFDKDMVRRVLAQSTTLPSPYKEVFYMKAVGDVPYTIIAEVFEKIENWARVTYYRARKMVAERVGNNE